MLINEKLQIIKSDESLTNLLEEFCDCITLKENETEEDYHFYTKEKYQVFVTNGGGGTFGFIGDNDINTSPIGYVSSEGECGKIANNINDFLSLIVFFPYFWSDAIRFYSENKEDGLAEYMLACENEIKEDNPNYYDTQNEIATKLSIRRSDGILEVLIATVESEPKFRAHSIEGDNECEQLL